MKRRVLSNAIFWAMLMSPAFAEESVCHPHPASPGIATPRTLSAIKLDIHSALRAEATSRRTGPNAPDILRLIDLYHEMADHPQRNNSEILAQMGRQVRGRLANIREHIERKTTRPREHSSNVTFPGSAIAPTHVLAQQVPAANPNAAGPPAQAIQPATGATNANRSIDYGPELAELIQQIISPATWDINGGPGSVVYFSQSRVLVVSAPLDVHPQVGKVLGQLRAAP